jgi:hypothetical protein
MREAVKEARANVRSWSTTTSNTPSRSTSTSIADGERQVIGGIMEHIEEAGVHSGDSTCVMPPYTLSDRHPRRDPRATATKLAQALRRRRPR